MPNLSINDRILCSIRGTLLGQQIITTYTYEVTSIVGTPEMNAALDAFLTAFSGVGKVRATYLAITAEAYTMDEVWAQIILPTRYAARRLVVDLTGLNDEGEYLTANVAATITRRGDLARRDNVGSVHIPIGQSNAEIEDGSVTASMAALLNLHAAQIPLDITTAVPNVVYTPVLGGNTAPGQGYPITSAFIQQTVRTMRRRTLGLGI